MSKELEALEKIDNTLCLNLNNKTLKFGLDKYDNCDCKDLKEFDECYNTIEKALKDYENLKFKHRSMQDAVLEDFKKLKALEIIKNKQVDVGWFIKCYNDYSNDEDRLMMYNQLSIDDNSRYLAQQEYDLLKEVWL